MENLGDLTVAEIKTELARRDVHFQSKLRKQDLLDLLRESLHLPVLSEGARQNVKKKKNKSQRWGCNDPVRKLLCFEFKEGNIPLDPNEMGPAEIYCKYHEAEEFQNTNYDELFIQRLKGLRELILKEEPLLKWNDQHPARCLLFDEIAAGNVPSNMDAEEVWGKFSTTKEFQMRGMKFNDTFRRRLADLRKMISRDRSRAIDDKAAVIIAMKTTLRRPTIIEVSLNGMVQKHSGC